MEFNYLWIVCAVLGYLLGNVETAVLLSKSMYHDDVRKHGSGNAGTTNMLRVFGMKSGIITFVGDFSKGIIAVLIGRLICGEVCGYICGAFAVLGHDFPVLFKFKGGKGVATSLGVAWMVAPTIAAVATLVGFTIIYISQMVSLGSMIGFVGFTIATVLFNLDNIPLIIMCIVLLVLLLLRHTDNIRRIIRGEESKLFKRKTK
ncbi:MAG: glycerol-3-phosphate 1-O-acyltransferase PlsY [Clostridia bacterium]